MLTVRELTAGYGGRRVLRGVSFAARAGESVALLGPNGSGKTTLLRVISGVLRPESGHLSLKGKPLEQLRPRSRARLAGSGAAARRSSVRPERAADGAFRTLSLSFLAGRVQRPGLCGRGRSLAATAALDLADRRVSELSGGELQRVLLARALAQQCPLLLLDELAAGLDLARMVELFDLLERCRTAGTCVLMAMHDCNLAALYATRLIGLKNGHVLFDGPASHVFTEEKLSALYDIPIRVFPHPQWGLPQALPGRAAGRGIMSLLPLISLLAALLPPPTLAVPPTLPQSERLSGVAAAADSAPRKNAPARPLSVTDDAGVTVTLDKPATRIIALYGAYNELLLALDARAVLVARTVADARLPALAELADLPVIGTHMRPNAELIVAQKPDLVLQLSGRKEAQLQSEALRTLGVNVLTFEMDSFEQMFDVLAKIGLLTGREQKAAALIKDWRARLAALKARYAGQKPVRVFYEVRYPNLLAAGKVSIVNEIIACAGGENVVGEEKKLVRFNEEALIQADP